MIAKQIVKFSQTISARHFCLIARRPHADNRRTSLPTLFIVARIGYEIFGQKR